MRARTAAALMGTWTSALLALANACTGDSAQTLTPPPALDGASSAPTDGSSATVDAGSPDTTSSPPVDAGPLCGRVTVSAFVGSGDPGDRDGLGTAAELSTPESITVDLEGTLLIGDSGNTRIRRVTPSGATTTLRTKLEGVEPGFLALKRIQQGPNGVYVIDSRNDRLVKVLPDTSEPGTFEVRRVVTSSSVLALGVNPFGPVLIGGLADCVIRKVFDGPPGRVERHTGVEDDGGDDGCGFIDGPIATARFSRPITDFTFDKTGNAYVLDSQNRAVRKVDKDGTVVTITPKALDPDASTLVEPTALTFGDDNVLYVSDKTRIHAVQLIDGSVTTVAGATSAGTTEGEGCVAKFTNIKGIVYFASTLYVVDTNRIRKVALP